MHIGTWENALLIRKKGESKARYGSYLVKRFSQELSEEYGTGFSVANIRNCRQLYLTFPKESYSLFFDRENSLVTS